MMKELTDKAKLFAVEMLACDFNATQAAINAGYSRKNAGKQGYKLLQDPRVRAAMADAMKARSERTKVDADWLLFRLAEEVKADLADLYFENGSIKPVHEWPLIWRQGLVSGLKVKQDFMYEDGQQVPDGFTVEVKLSDRVKRLEMIGKHVDVKAFEEVVRTPDMPKVMVVPGCSSVEDWEKHSQEHHETA